MSETNSSSVLEIAGLGAGDAPKIKSWMKLALGVLPLLLGWFFLESARAGELALEEWENEGGGLG